MIKCELCGSEHKELPECTVCGKKVCDKEECSEFFDMTSDTVCRECLNKQVKRSCSDCKNEFTEKCPMDGYSYCYDCPEYDEIDSSLSIGKLIKDSHQNAVAHGWWDEPKRFGELIALIHSEASEALEEFRNGCTPTEEYFNQEKPDKPEGIPSELADIVIRVADLCGWYDIDLEEAIRTKMKYNASRPFKHGGKKL